MQKILAKRRNIFKHRLKNNLKILEKQIKLFSFINKIYENIFVLFVEYNPLEKNMNKMQRKPIKQRRNTKKNVNCKKNSVYKQQFKIKKNIK